MDPHLWGMEPVFPDQVLELQYQAQRGLPKSSLPDPRRPDGLRRLRQRPGRQNCRTDGRKAGSSCGARTSGGRGRDRRPKAERSQGWSRRRRRNRSAPKKVPEPEVLHGERYIEAVEAIRASAAAGCILHIRAHSFDGPGYVEAIELAQKWSQSPASCGPLAVQPH